MALFNMGPFHHRFFLVIYKQAAIHKASDHNICDIFHKNDVQKPQGIPKKTEAKILKINVSA